MVVERIPSEGSERARGLGSEVGERLGGRGELGGAETLRAWRARGVQGAYSTCMRGAVGVGEAAARECRVQRAIKHSHVAVERGVKHSRALEESARVTARALASVSPRTCV